MKFAGSTLADFYGGALSASLATGACVALGVATCGVSALACGIDGGAAGGEGFGETGGKVVVFIMDKIL